MPGSPNPDVAPWQSRSGQMYLSDREVLEELNGQNHATPKDLAESRRRENVLRVQCRYLVKCGLVTSVADDVFKLSEGGEAFLSGSYDPPTTRGFVDISSLTNPPEWRLSDFSAIDPTLVKRVNADFFEDSSNDYGWVNGDRALTERRIWNVKGWQVERLLREFPRIDSLPAQCAHWMRAIVGIHFFPDANHRTGMATLYGLLDANDVAPPTETWPGDDIGRAVLKSKLLRALHVTPTFDTLWLQDELFVHWHRYFTGLLCDGKSPTSNIPSADYLRKVLEYAREERMML